MGGQKAPRPGVAGMSAFTGKQYEGAMRDHRKAKRAAAEARNAITPRERTAEFRRVISAVAAIMSGGAE